MMATFDLRKMLGLGTIFGLKQAASEVVTTRVVVTEADSFVVPARIKSLRIYTGRAWVSYQTKDFFMYSGQELRLTQGKTAVITAIGRKPITVDLYSQKR